MNYKLVILTVLGLLGRALCDVNCPSFTNCQDCYAQDSVCGWCASDADGGGSCIQKTNTGQPVTPCPSGYWNYWCCSLQTSCDDCSKANEVHNCKWCESGSSVNGNKCIPYNSVMQPQLGGCDTNYYTNNCCGDYTTCDTCSQANSHLNCRWCQTGSTVNGGTCVPYDSDENPMWGGCDAEYFTNNCCGNYTTCDTCSAANYHINCRWCQTGSSVNENKCIPYDSSENPMWGGCDSDYYTNNCCDNYTTCDECSKGNEVYNCKWCQTGSTVNGGTCVPYDGSENPLCGGCDSGYYSNYCCDDYSTCDACSGAAAADLNLQCKWCQTGSKVNGGKCIPYGGSENPLWGGCDSGYYSNYCCDDYSTCDACSAAAAADPNLQCKWCQTGSSVNAGKCLPYGGSENPLWGGCDDDYYTNWCCKDMQTCTDCIAKGWNCKWCGGASTVNPSECLPYHGSGEAMCGGCDAGNFTDKCPNQAFISF